MNLNTLTPYYKVIADAQSRALDGTCYVVRGLAPTANGTGLRVDVAAGDTVEAGVPHFAYAGGNVTCTAASATLARRDIVYRSSAGTLTLGTGTAAAVTSTTPVPPALPASATLIAVVFIAAGQTTLVATDVEDCRQTRVGDASAINVKAFGATGDGTTNDTALIQGALDSVPSGGATVFFPPGTYNVTSLAPKSNTRLLGAGSSVTTLKLRDGQAASTRIISLGTGQTGVTVEALGFDGNKANQAADAATQQSHIIFGDHVSQVRVTNCLLSNASGDGIQLYGLGATPSTLCQISNNHITGSRRNGVTIDGCTTTSITGNLIVSSGLQGIDVEPDADTQIIRDIVIANNTVFGSIGNGASGAAISVSGRQTIDSENFRRIVISGNTVDGNSVATVAGIGVYVFSEFTITANTIRLPGTFGIQIQSGRGTVTGNTIRDTPSQGIIVGQFAGGSITPSRMTISNNVVSHFGTTAQHGIQLGDVTDSVCSGNVVYDAAAGTFGIYLLGTSLRNVISGNVIDNPGAVAGGGAAINESASSNNNTITANYVANYSNTILFVGAGTQIFGNKGYNPRGSVTAPAFPASTVTATNTTGGWITAYVANGANAITVVAVNGVTTGLQIAVNGWGSVRCGPGQTMAFTYGGGAPAWTWFGD